MVGSEVLGEAEGGDETGEGQLLVPGLDQGDFTPAVPRVDFTRTRWLLS